MFFTRAEVQVGLRCMAPLKGSAKSSKRTYQDVEVTWASDDGMVVEVRPVWKKGMNVPAPKGISFSVTALRPLGTKAPLGVVL